MENDVIYLQDVPLMYIERSHSMLYLQSSCCFYLNVVLVLMYFPQPDAVISYECTPLHVNSMHQCLFPVVLLLLLQ